MKKEHLILLQTIFNPGLLLGLFLLFSADGIFAQNATISEQKEIFRTYPFSDPSPVAQINRIYPYFKFDGYSHTAQDQAWKVVKLENPYIKVLVAPEMGGKVLGAIEKSTNRPFIYFNRVVKFREIALRGPWTSGGIEFNFGTIGHTPATATPVDYLLQKNKDGSVSCVVGALDLPSRTEWRVEIRLPKDKALFETRSFWHNPTVLNTSFYHWMNAAADAGSDLHFFYPGQYYLDHGGRAFPWPIDKTGRDISIYSNNNFGASKSYHVMGTYTDYFAANWKNDNFGVAHWSLYGDKPGKKIWIWALSRQGDIWKNLLTDADLGNKQYVEIQTGLLINQAGSHSNSTPFKHLFFAPNSVERFSEAWFPFKKLGGVVAANHYGSLNVVLNNKILRFGFCPVQKINDELTIHVAEEKIYTKHLSLEPMEVFLDSISLDKPGGIKVILGNRLLYYDSKEENAKKLSRPVTANKKFNWNSIGGLYTAATEMAKQRDYKTALDKYLTCLEKDPAFSPALVGIAEIYYRRMEYLKALEYVSKALANDAYDADANFIYGITSKKLGNIYDALDGFSFAARSMQYRSAANVQMAEIYFKEQNMAMVEEYANRAIAYNRFNLNALKLLVLSYRKQDKTQAAESTLNKILAIDPLNHFGRFESYLLQNKKEKLDAFTAMIRNELPHETFLELAIYYANLGLFDEAIWVLDKAPSHAMVFYWLSYLYDLKGESEKSALYLDKAFQASPRLVYPFREETAEMLQWALKKRSDWKTKYYTGLLYWSKDRIQLAEKFFADCQDRPDFAPFYLTRGNLFKATRSEQALNDYKKAIELDKNEWRAYHILTEYYNEQALYDKALATIESGARKFPENYILNFDYASALLHNRKYAASLSVLDDINILPYEGARYGHDTYRQACLLYALDYMDKGQYETAIQLINKAKLWPENLGVGKPYEVDIRLENYLEALCQKKMKHESQAARLYEEIIEYTSTHLDNWDSNLFVSVLTLKDSGKEAKAKEIMNDWIKKYPANVVAQWCFAIFNHDSEKAQEIIEKTKTEAQQIPWNPVKNDYNFKLVMEMVKIIEQP